MRGVKRQESGARAHVSAEHLPPTLTRGVQLYGRLSGVSASLGQVERTPRAEIAENEIVAGRFRLIRLIGKGGMGSVWEATHLSLDIPCAVKFITCEGGDPDTLVRRFEREAKAAAGIGGRHVVRILDHGMWEDVPYIAMERLHGETLRARLERMVVLPPEEVLRTAKHVARALRKAHERGIVHRDLKPDNIFLVIDDDGTQANDAWLAKVLDFGIAKLVTNESIANRETSSGDLLGTPVYMSPEQIRGSRNIDARSDLWSLAVIVFRCLTGDLPFVGKSFGDLVLAVCTRPLIVPSAMAAVPEGFDEWWRTAAAREPEDRFQTAREFSKALERVLAPQGSSDGTGDVTAPRSYALSMSDEPSVFATDGSDEIPDSGVAKGARAPAAAPAFRAAAFETTVRERIPSPHPEHDIASPHPEPAHDIASPPPVRAVRAVRVVRANAASVHDVTSTPSVHDIAAAGGYPSSAGPPLHPLIRWGRLGIVALLACAVALTSYAYHRISMVIDEPVRSHGPVPRDWAAPSDWPEAPAPAPVATTAPAASSAPQTAPAPEPTTTAVSNPGASNASSPSPASSASAPHRTVRPKSMDPDPPPRTGRTGL